MKKNAFTLIELLAVIVILAIISLIATPIVLNTINTVKEKAFIETINSIEKGIKIESIINSTKEEVLYKYENNNWIENKVDLDVHIPKYIEIKVNEAGDKKYAITDGEYCAIKTYDKEVVIKKISTKNDEKNIEEKYCKLETDASCFEYAGYYEGITIKDYYCYKGNKNGYPEISDIEIPNKINGQSVLAIAPNAFKSKNLTSIDFIQMIDLNRISYEAFSNNKITSIKNLDACKNLKTIEAMAFQKNDLPYSQAFVYGRKEVNGEYVTDLTKIVSYGGKNKDIIIPSNVEIIDNEAFKSNYIKSLDLSKAVNLKYIKGYAFQINSINNIDFGECQNLEEISSHAFWSGGTIENLDLSKCKNLKKIGDYAFYFFGVVNLKLSNLINLESIGYRAFTANFLETVDLTNCPKLNSIGKEGFESGRLTHIKNGTGKSFDWNLIINGESGEIFEKGSIVNTNGNKTVIIE